MYIGIFIYFVTSIVFKYKILDGNVLTEERTVIDLNRILGSSSSSISISGLTTVLQKSNNIIHLAFWCNNKINKAAQIGVIINVATTTVITSSAAAIIAAAPDLRQLGLRQFRGLYQRYRWHKQAAAEITRLLRTGEGAESPFFHNQHVGAPKWTCSATPSQSKLLFTKALKFKTHFRAFL